MASSGKKEYTLKINGVTKNIKDFTSLEEAVRKYNDQMERTGRTVETSARVSKQKAAALTEEEKAEKKLVDTIDRVVRARTDANKAQVEANIAAREAQRQVTLEAQVNRAAANSVEQMRANLSLLKNEWKDLDVGSDKFKELTVEIDALNNKIKAAEQSTGDFRRNVGNYPDAMAGLEKLSSGIDTTTKASMGLAQSLLASNQVMFLFGDTSEESAKKTQFLQKIMALLSIAQGINNNLLKSGVIATKSATVAEAAHTIQIRARASSIALSTKNTWLAVAAQKALQLVSKPGPFLLVSAAITAGVTAITAYASSSEDAAKKTDKYVSSIDGSRHATLEARDANDNLLRSLRDIQIDLDVATGKLSKYEAEMLKLKNTGRDAVEDLLKDEERRIAELDGEYKDFFNTMGWYFKNLFTTWDTSFTEKRLKEQRDAVISEWAKTDEAVRKQREKNSKEDIVRAEESAKEIRKRNEDLNNANIEGLRGTLAKIQTERLREEANAIEQNKVLADINRSRNNDEQLALNDLSAIQLKYDKQRETAIKEANKKASDEWAANLQKRKAALEKELALVRQSEDDETQLIVNEFDRRREETRIKYERQRVDLEKQLEEDKTLTVKGQTAIRNIIKNLNEHWEAEDLKTHEAEIADQKAKQEKAEKERKELLDKRIADSDRRNSLLLSGLDIALEQAQQKIGELVARNKDGLNLINVEATRANLKASNEALDEYIAGLKKAQDALKDSHGSSIALLKEGTPEYEEELQKFAQANIEINDDLKEANKQREENTKASNELIITYYKELFNGIGEAANKLSEVYSYISESLNTGLELQIESLNEQLESVTERYGEVIRLREESTSRVEDLEKRLQDATGGTAEALKEQLQQEMHDRADLEREEAKLAKEKEKREAQIAKKERQMKRNSLIGDIAKAGANTALGATRALEWGWPLGPVFAGLVAGFGLYQVGVMTQQLSKLEDGGLITGPSHVNGGARIQGTNIEVEGGEYVVNKKSTAANARLIEFINSSPTAVTAADLVGVLPSNAGAPIVESTTAGAIDYEALAEAMANINITPTVAVADIIDVQDDLVTVSDAAGF